MVTERVNYIFKFFNLVFDILTFGWIAEILFFIGTLMFVFSILMFFSKGKIMKHLLGDRLHFAKVYLYHYIKQKIFFLKSFFHIVKGETMKALYITVGMIIFCGFILFLLIKYVF